MQRDLEHEKHRETASFAEKYESMLQKCFRTCGMPHQEDESLCAFVLWRAYVLGVLRGVLLHCKK